MSNYRILVASPVNQRYEILQKFAQSLMNLRKDGLSLEYFFIDDNTQNESSRLLLNLNRILKGIIVSSGEAALYVKDERIHHWDAASLQKMSRLRNEIMSIAKEKEVDYLFFVDSDLLLHPDTLINLVEQKKDIVSEIYWTSWVKGGAKFPQVWLYDNYAQYEKSPNEIINPEIIKERTDIFHNMLKTPGIYKVGGVGGCTLLSREVINSQVSFSRIENLTFAGEDRHFSVRAAVAGFEMYVDTIYPAFHVYRISDIPEADNYIKRCGYTFFEL